MTIASDVLSFDEIQMANVKDDTMYQDPGFAPEIYWDGTPDIITEPTLVLEDPGAVMNPPILQEYPADYPKEIATDTPLETAPTYQDAGGGSTAVVEEKKNNTGLILLAAIVAIVILK